MTMTLFDVASQRRSPERVTTLFVIGALMLFAGQAHAGASAAQMRGIIKNHLDQLGSGLVTECGERRGRYTNKDVNICRVAVTRSLAMLAEAVDQSPASGLPAVADVLATCIEQNSHRVSVGPGPQAALNFTNGLSKCITRVSNAGMR